MIKKLCRWLRHRQETIPTPQIIARESVENLIRQLNEAFTGRVHRITTDEMKAMLQESVQEVEKPPKMIRNPYLASLWNDMTDEQKIWAEIFHPDEMPDIPGKLYCIRWPQYWYEV